MKKIYLVLVSLLIANLVNAQFSEVWKGSYVYNSVIIGCENMDNDSNKEIVSIRYDSSTGGYREITVTDAITGEIQWTSTGWYFKQENIKLVDVNNDGKYELLVSGSGPGDGQYDSKLHLFAFGGLTKSAQISASSSVQIENFPNPFSTVTTIKYNVPVKSLVVVKVFDMNGNEIKTLANAQQSQGDYEIPFNRADLQNGTYFYQVKVGSQVGAKKMVVIE